MVFYCHFPDLLLTHHTTVLRRLYRKPIDFIEEITTGLFPNSLLFFYYVFSVNFVSVEPNDSHLLLLGGLQAWLISYLLIANSLHLPLRVHSSVFMQGESNLLFFILLLMWTNSTNLILISNKNYCISLASCNSRHALEMS